MAPCQGGAKTARRGIKNAVRTLVTGAPLRSAGTGPRENSVLGTPKRMVVGRALRSDRLGDTLLPKSLALPVFCSDPLCSVGYATEQIVLVLGLGGLSLPYLTPWSAVGVVALLVIVPASYRQTCHAYPDGGGAYAVSRRNLGPTAALVAAIALLADYALTVAVSVVAGVAAVTSASASLAPHAVALSVGCIVVVTVVNLRGIKKYRNALRRPHLRLRHHHLRAVGGGFGQGPARGTPCRRERQLGCAQGGPDRRLAHGLPRAAGLRERLHCTDRRRGDQRRRPVVQEAEEQERRQHARYHVPVSRLHEPTLRVLAFTRVIRPHDLIALTVQVDPEKTGALVLQWAERGIPVPLAVFDSPYREISRPLLE